MTELWMPLVDGPIEAIVSEIEAEEPSLRDLVDSPQKALAFRRLRDLGRGSAPESGTPR